MSIPDEPGPNDPMFDRMKEQLADIEIPLNETSVEKLTDLQLAEELAKVNDQLRKTGEMYKVGTQRGRELHSRRSALQIQLNKRSSS